MACNTPAIDSVSTTQLKEQFIAIGEIEDESLKNEKISVLWDSLTTNQLIPFTHDSTVVFLYKGEAESVAWNGDFNSWSNDDNFYNEGTRFKGTDIWSLTVNFPSDARVDYKVTINEDQWILDPENPNQQWSGFGPNSELRMPDWQDDPLVKPMEGVSKGTLSEHILIDSKILGYSVQYKVYTPYGYDQLSDLPVLYTTDGQEYSHEKLGSLPIVLDNLIYADKINPVITVFVEPLDPDDETMNRRGEEMALTENYLNFFVDELIPHIEANYKVNASNKDRVILGTSLGGLNSTYFSFARPDIFDGAVIQAPAFWYRKDIYGLVKNAETYPSNIFMSVGTIGDNTINTRKMKAIFEKKGIDFTYLEVNQGHSWGAWGHQMDTVLLQFFGK